MRKMTAQDAAREIGGDVDREQSTKLAADQQHFIRFVEQVTKELRLVPSIANMIYIAGMLSERDIRPAVEEYPKALTSGGKAVLDPSTGLPIIFQDAAEEAAFHAAAEPAEPEVPQGSEPDATAVTHTGSPVAGSNEGPSGGPGHGSAPGGEPAGSAAGLLNPSPAQPVSSNPIGRPAWADPAPGQGGGSSGLG